MLYVLQFNLYLSHFSQTEDLQCSNVGPSEAGYRALGWWTEYQFRPIFAVQFQANQDATRCAKSLPKELFEGDFSTFDGRPLGDFNPS